MCVTLEVFKGCCRRPTEKQTGPFWSLPTLEGGRGRPHAPVRAQT